MECFRLSHAGILLALDDAALLVDPGNFSSASEVAAALNTGHSLSALVITHEHTDHWTPEHVAAVRLAAPSAPIFTTAATAAQLAEQQITNVTVVADGDTHQVGPFSLSFYGGRHEVLHASIPLIDNVGVRINDTIAFGGDSLVRPPFTTDVLGVPIGSPWSNLSQVMNFVLDARPKRAYLTHDGMLSERGLGLFRDRVNMCLDQVGGKLIELPHIEDAPQHGYLA